MGVWLSAIVGMALKLSLPGRFDRLAIILCLLLGWSGVIAYESLASAIPSYGFSRSGASSTRSARFFMSGSACAFKTRSGMVWCCSRQVAIIRQSSLACPGHKRPFALCAKFTIPPSSVTFVRFDLLARRKSERPSTLEMAATQTSQGTLGLRDPYCRAPGKFSRRDFPRGGFHAKIFASRLRDQGGRYAVMRR